MQKPVEQVLQVIRVISRQGLHLDCTIAFLLTRAVASIYSPGIGSPGALLHSRSCMIAPMAEISIVGADVGVSAY